MHGVTAESALVEVCRRKHFADGQSIAGLSAFESDGGTFRYRYNSLGGRQLRFVVAAEVGSVGTGLIVVPVIGIVDCDFAAARLIGVERVVFVNATCKRNRKRADKHSGYQ